MYFLFVLFRFKSVFFLLLRRLKEKTYIFFYVLQVQNNKQLLSSYAKKTHDRNVAPYRIPDQESSKINPKWTQEEQLLGVQGKNDTNILYI